MLPIIRQLEEKNVANEIDLLLWSDRMDLVAFSNVKGEVALHRLTWTRAWSMTPPKDGDVVNAMTWRPDGEVLAVGYKSGELLLLNVENKETLHRISVEGDVATLGWVQEKRDGKADKKLLAKEEENKKNLYTQSVDFSDFFLPDLPPQTSYSATNVPEINVNIDFFREQKELNLLLVGTSDGYLYIYVFGIFLLASIDLSRHCGAACAVVAVHTSEDLSRTFATVRDAEGRVCILALDTSLLRTHRLEIFNVATKYQRVRSVVTYLHNSIANIKESWETILLEMDSKLSKYASKVAAGTLSADFLELLMFGNATDEMQEFLLQDLTKKGLEKFGQTIEMSYANIQKLLLKNITKVGQDITFHLAELRGMARYGYRYEVLGLDEDQITETISANGSFLVKSGEMQQIINNSMLNYKAFFRWLYSAIMHLMYETVPPEIPKMTQQDLSYIAEFLRNFDQIGAQNNTTIGGTEKPGFIMERLGQYLKDSPLTIQPNMEMNEWSKFLAEHPCIADLPLVVKHHREMSLVQQFAMLEERIAAVFEKPKATVSTGVGLIQSLACLRTEGKPKTTSINTSASGLLYVFLPNEHPPSGFYFLELDATCKACFVGFNLPDRNITDVKFYTEGYLTMLLEDRAPAKTASLMQLPVAGLRELALPFDGGAFVTEQGVVRADALEAAPGALKSIAMAASKFAVSGCRKVCVVLSENRKKVMLFEMEGDEEEEEDADMTNSTVRESDASMQEASDAE